MTARVLVTRAAGTWPGLTERFRGTPVVLEMAPTTIQVEPIDPRAGNEAIDRLHRYDWLVATSGQGVKALVLRLAARGILDLPAGMRVAAVGPATARALLGIGARVELVADDTGSDGLAALLSARLSGGSRVLLVRPEGGASLLAAMLRARGAEVDEAPLYRTVVSNGAKGLVDAVIAETYDAVVLTAPSSLELWLDAAGARRSALVAALARTRRVAIGPTTAAHLAAIGLPADAVADHPSEDAVGDAIARALRI